MSEYILSAFKQDGYKIAVHCESCQNSSWLDYDKAIERLGPDHGTLAKDLIPYLRCAKCRSKNCVIRIHPPDIEQMKANAARRLSRQPG